MLQKKSVLLTTMPLLPCLRDTNVDPLQELYVLGVRIPRSPLITAPLSSFPPVNYARFSVCLWRPLCNTLLLRWWLPAIQRKIIGNVLGQRNISDSFLFSLNVTLILLITIKLIFNKMRACYLAPLSIFLLVIDFNEPSFQHGQIDRFCSTILALRQQSLSPQHLTAPSKCCSERNHLLC